VALAMVPAAASLSACAPKPAAQITRVLFIGNSYTARNGGIDAALKRLAPTVEASAVVHDGFTLRDHWLDGSALAAIRDGRWDYVILQEQSVSAVLAEPRFFQYGMVFNRSIVLAGAHTVLLETWQRPDSVGAGVTAKTIGDAYTALGESIGAKVAPAGRAFAASLAQRPDIELNLPDGHPTPAGTYLAACVVFGTIFGRTPVGNVATDPAIPAQVQVCLRQQAARALGY
jgi:hypothetical protein